jgi:phage anti-repressor protein
MPTKEDILGQCIVCGNVIKLPSQQLDRKLYLEVAKALQLIGGKWKGGKMQVLFLKMKKKMIFQNC